MIKQCTVFFKFLFNMHDSLTADVMQNAVGTTENSPRS